MTALAAIFISGCRTAFLFVLLAVIYLIFSGKTSFWVKALVVLLLAVFLLVAGGIVEKTLAADDAADGAFDRLRRSVRVG